MKTKILFLDLDGTVLDSHENVPEENIKAIKKAKEAGIITVISTGRAQFESQYVIDAVQPDYFSGLNGSTVRNINTNDIIYKRMLDLDIAQQVMNLMERTDIDYMICSHTGTYCLPSTLTVVDSLTFSPPFLERFGDFIKPLEDLEQIGAAKFFAMAKTNEDAERFLEELKKISVVTAVPVMENGFDILPANQNKAVSAQMLCEKLGIEPRYTAAIGDSENDLELMKFVECSIAPENAFPSVKAICKYTVPSNDENGVAYAIYNILGV